MGRNSFDKSGDFKLCTGPLHREGAMLPIRSFFKHRDGSLFAQCRGCNNFHHGRDEEAGLIPWEDAQPLFERLYAACGGKTHAAEALGLNRNSFSRKGKAVRRVTFNRARKLLDEIDEQKRYQQGEAEIVDAEPLGSIIRAWVVDWLQERPRNLKKGKSVKGWTNETMFMGPINYLSEWTGLHPARVEQISNGKHPRVPLSQADAILVAMGDTLSLHPEIKIRANPNWTMEKWLDYMAERGCI